MADLISNTSPLLYLYRLGNLDWLRQLFDSVWIPSAVVSELRQGLEQGYDVPKPDTYHWLKVVDPIATPSEWLVLDLGAGEIAAMALALENRSRIVLLDDALARKIAQGAGLTVWGTLKILLEAKARGYCIEIAPLVERLAQSGMGISEDIRKRVLVLANE
jgi:predicted nucleic acid-binding protein